MKRKLDNLDGINPELDEIENDGELQGNVILIPWIKSKLRRPRVTFQTKLLAGCDTLTEAALRFCL
jgi:hypothetical protein